MWNINKRIIFISDTNKNNEICYPQGKTINFFDLDTKEIRASIPNADGPGVYKTFNIVAKDLLIIGGDFKMYVVNIIQYRIIRIIDMPFYFFTNGFCMVNKNTFLTIGSLDIIKWKIEGDSITLISKKDKAHN